MRVLATLALVALGMASTVHAASGVWNTTNNNELWSTAGDWTGSVADSGGTADFSQAAITAPTTVHLDSSRDPSFMVFAPTGAASWVIDNNGNSSNAITFPTVSSALTVTVSSGTATIAANLSSPTSTTSGNILNLNGGGDLVIAGVGQLVPNDGGNKTSYFDIEGGSELDVTGSLQTMILNSSNRTSAANPYLGNTSGNNTLKVLGSGKLVTGNFNIGSAGNNGNKVYISAPGTIDSSSTSMPTGNTWVLYGNSAALNMNSSNNLVQIDSGAAVNQISGGGSPGWNIGNAAGSNNNQFIVTGASTAVNKSSSGNMNVGNIGSNNYMEVSAGAVFVGGKVFVGTGDGTNATNNNEELITGSGGGAPTYLRLNGSTNGDLAVGTMNNSSSNSFQVANGARVDIFSTTSSRNLGIGVVAGANNNYVSVSGVGSQLNLLSSSQEFTVGGKLSVSGGSGAHIDVLDGGTLNMSNLDNSLALPATVSWTTWAANPITSTALDLAGPSSAVNLGNGTANMSLLKVGVNVSRSEAGVILQNATSALNMNNGELTSGTSGSLVSGPGSINLLGSGFFSTAFTSTISSTISGAGSLTKLGAGQLILAGAVNYTGDTNVSAGTLTFNSDPFSGSGNVSVAASAGAVLDLEFGTSDTVGGFYVNGVNQGTGTFNSSTDPGVITGGGSLTVVAVPEPSTLALLACSVVTFGWYRRRQKAKRAC